MHDLIEAILYKAPVCGLAVHVGTSGLCLGDPATLRLGPDGRVGVFARVWRRWLLFARRADRRIGDLGPRAGAMIAPALARGEALRVRIVGLTPEHLARDGRADVHVSVWGSARMLAAARPPGPGQSAAAPDDADAPPPA